jgi:hypothetical protein
MPDRDEEESPTTRNAHLETKQQRERERERERAQLLLYPTMLPVRTQEEEEEEEMRRMMIVIVRRSLAERQVRLCSKCLERKNKKRIFFSVYLESSRTGKEGIYSLARLWEVEEGAFNTP